MNVDIIQSRHNCPSYSNLIPFTNKRLKLVDIKNNLENRIGVQTIIKFEVVKKIPKSPSGKFRLVIRDNFY